MLSARHLADRSDRAVVKKQQRRPARKLPLDLLSRKAFKSEAAELFSAACWRSLTFAFSAIGGGLPRLTTPWSSHLMHRAEKKLLLKIRLRDPDQRAHRGCDVRISGSSRHRVAVAQNCGGCVRGGHNKRNRP